MRPSFRALIALALTCFLVDCSCTQYLKMSGLEQSRRADALFIRGQAYHRTRRLTQAAADYAAATAITPRNEDIWVAWANLDLRRGDMQGYVEKVEKAASLNEHSARVLRAIGQMFWVSDDNEKALGFYGKALEIDPSEPFALLHRVEIYRAERKFAEAIADANALVALPRDVINRDGYLDRDGNVRDFHIAALILRAELYQAVGQSDRAAKDYETAVSDGRTVPALVAQAKFLAREKPSQEALALLEEAGKKESGNASAQFALGVELIFAQRFEPAMAAFDHAIAARPGFAMAYKMRARMHRQLGQTEDAVKDFMQAIEADPSIIEESMPAFRFAGYWTSPDMPKQVTPELKDAIRACMLDTTCN
jgi:tetratricopeptide (TPR) repeat protein